MQGRRTSESIAETREVNRKALALGNENKMLIDRR